MTPYPLYRSQTNTKILITLFLFSILAAFGFAGLNIYDKVGRSTSGGAAHRYGPEKMRDESALNVGISPSEELPIEDASDDTLSPAEPLAARMNRFGSLMDITHPHIFQIPIVLFVLAHFLMRTRASEWFKLTNYIASFGGMASFIAAPWMVRYWSIQWTPLLYVGASAMGVSALTMTLVPIWDMWCSPKKDERQIVLPREPLTAASD
jgi:hypothetical protein